MHVNEAIKTKRAIRDYEDRPVPPNLVRDILNAGRRSQSAKNLQPWDYVVMQDRERLRQLAEQGKFSPFLAEAPLAVLILTPDPAERFQTLFDAGQTAAYMQLAAWEHGIGSCPVTSFNRDGVRTLLNIPPHRHIRIAVAFGYPALTGQTRKSSRTGRRPFDEVVHWETWTEKEG